MSWEGAGVMFRIAVVLICCSLGVSEMAGREDWLDPNDMLNFDPATKTMRNKPKMKDTVATSREDTNEPVSQVQASTTLPPPSPSSSEQSQVATTDCQSKKACKCEQAGLPLMRQYVKSLLGHLHGQVPHGGYEDYSMYITLSPDHVHILQSFVLTGDQRHIHDVSEILIAMVNRIVSSRMGRMEKAIEWVESKIGISLHRLLQVLGVFSLASVILLVEAKFQLPWRKRLWQLIILMFLISVPWTWYELLKQAEIKQQSFAMKDVPSECRNGSMNYWLTFKSYFLLQDDKCHAYYEHVLIDPMVKVPPTKAIAVTFVRFFLAPLKDIGTAVSEFIRALLIDLPITLYPVAIGIVAVFSFMFLFMWFGYSFRLPFLLSIERSPQLSVADSRLNEALTESSQQIMKQLEALQYRIESSEANTADKLRHLEQVQQLAIEYSASSDPSSPQPSPTVNVTKPYSMQPAITLVHSSSDYIAVVSANSGTDQINSKYSASNSNDSSEQADIVSGKLKNSVSEGDTQTPKQTQNVDTLMPQGIVNSE